MAREVVSKKNRYEELLRDEANLLLRQGFRDPRLNFVSFTKAELNDDYSLAKLYWDTFDAGHRGDIKDALSGITGKLRVMLSQKIELRHTPAIEFIYDSQYESEKKIENLLNQKDTEEN